MAKIEEIIAHLLAASEGEIIGRIRLQKMIYLLDQLGLGSGLRFTYHQYGPYAEGVTIAAQRAEFLNKSIKETEVESSYGGKYSIFRLVTPLSPSKVGELDFAKAKNYAILIKKRPLLYLNLQPLFIGLRKKSRLLIGEMNLFRESLTRLMT